MLHVSCAAIFARLQACNSHFPFPPMQEGDTMLWCDFGQSILVPGLTRDHAAALSETNVLVAILKAEQHYDFV